MDVCLDRRLLKGEKGGFIRQDVFVDRFSAHNNSFLLVSKCILFVYIIIE